jgi:choline dehydrogenase-like flavoprotein
MSNPLLIGVPTEGPRSAPADPIAEGLAKGWKVHGGPHAAVPATLECDVAIVGTGAGGGLTADMLTAAGLSVVMIEEGPLRSSRDFRAQEERRAYPELYMESANRQTADKAINILQGRCVGGSTTVNWTSSFRTPSPTLAHWKKHFGLADMSDEALSPWFLQAEQRLSIGPWLIQPNVNNHKLREGAARLGIPTAAILRNVNNCWNLGSCGLGCPTNAKQSMLVTAVPAALDRGATLLVQRRVQRIEFDGKGRVQALHCVPVQTNSAPAEGAACTVRAKHFVVAGGGINTPGLLLRSQAPDPHGLLGKRTFLHPVVATSAVLEERVEAWRGAPQTIYTDHFLETQAIDGPMGFKLEAPPLYPLIGAVTLTGFGAAQAELLKDFAHTHVLLALMRDGFHAESPGGHVSLRSDGSPVLHYELNGFFFEAARRAFLAMSEIQFAAGAKKVMPVHEFAEPYTTWAQAKAGINALELRPYVTRVVSAHVMGGCAMAGDDKRGVVRPDGVHWQAENLSIHDGSLFPTSIGANPQHSIYGIVSRLAAGLAKRLNGREVRWA